MTVNCPGLLGKSMPSIHELAEKCAAGVIPGFSVTHTAVSTSWPDVISFGFGIGNRLTVAGNCLCHCCVRVTCFADPKWLQTLLMKARVLTA